MIGPTTFLSVLSGQGVPMRDLVCDVRIIIRLVFRHLLIAIGSRIIVALSL